MNNKFIAPIVVVSTVFVGSHAAAQSDQGFHKRVYIGVGAGQSTLEPDTSAVDGLDVIDENDVAGQVTLGLDFSRRLTAEIQYAELGTADLSDGDGIEYANVSVSGLVYLWNGLASSDYLDFDGLDQRAGLSLYGRLGVGTVENEAVNTVQFENENDVQVIAGLGLEYSLAVGFGVRAELIRYDTDASYQGLSLLYRFGRPPIERDEDAVVLRPLPPPEPEPELSSPVRQPVEVLTSPSSGALGGAQSATVFADSDGDGVADDADGCQQTPPGTPVGSNGCEMFKGMLDGVNFLPDSATLTETSRVILDGVVNTLISFPDLRFSVQAHTDDRGSEAANLLLSRNRAIAVVRYLVSQGIPLDRMEARAFGETRPIADNNTRAGRLLNRRVEFVSIK